MPKINVYLPDDLASAVREAGIPVSPVCQKALAEAVRLVGRARKTVERLRDPDFDPTDVPQIASRIGSHMTPRLSEAIRLAREASGPTGRVETKHLLTGVLDEGHNLGIRLLQALGADPDELRDAVLQIHADEASPAAAGHPAAPGQAVIRPCGPGCRSRPGCRSPRPSKRRSTSGTTTSVASICSSGCSIPRTAKRPAFFTALASTRPAPAGR